MTDQVNAEIIAIGTELLLGEITDTNSVYLARQLRDIGINLYFMTSVGDNHERITRAIQIAMERADVIITCGGLGPTVDDMTRQAVATATNRELVFHEYLRDQIAARFAQFNATMTENNLRQAYLPDGAIAIENPVGTAPCYIVEHESNAVISLPGVPRELKFLYEESIKPYLREKYNLGIIKARILKTAGIGESSLDDMLGEELLNRSNPSIGLAAHQGIIDIRMTAKADTEAEADTLLETIAQDVIERAGPHIFGEGDTRLEEVLVALLRKHNASITLIEAGLGGVIGSALRSTPEGELIIHAERILNHPDDLQEERFSEMSMKDIAISLAQESVTQNGTVGSIVILSLPDAGDRADLDYATTVALYTNGTIKSRVYGFGSENELARAWVTRWSMSNLWRQLKEYFEHAE